MKMDRNLNADGSGKYALVNLRTLREAKTACLLPPGEIEKIEDALEYLHRRDILDYGFVDGPSEFFVLKLKDRHSQAALLAYAHSVRASDPEFADEVEEMAKRSGVNHFACKEPD